MFFFHIFVCDGLINQERQTALLAFSPVKKPWRPCDCQDVGNWQQLFIIFTVEEVRL
jgi:hypothetical protein